MNTTKRSITLLILCATQPIPMHATTGLKRLGAFFVQMTKRQYAHHKVSSPKQAAIAKAKEQSSTRYKRTLQEQKELMKIQKALDEALFKAAGFFSLAHLLESGADANARDAHGRTALHLAARAGDHEAVKLLLKKGASPLAIDRTCATPITKAIDCYSDHEDNHPSKEMLRDLIEACAHQPNARYHAIKHAMEYGTLAALRITLTTPSLLNPDGLSINDLVHRELKELRSVLMRKDNSDKTLEQLAIDLHKNVTSTLLDPDKVEQYYHTMCNNIREKK